MEKGTQRQFSVNSFPPLQLPGTPGDYNSYIAGVTGMCTKSNNELLYGNYVETMVGK